MPLPRTKKPLLSSAPSITAINQFASGNTSNNNNNNNHINNGISNPPSAVSFAPTTSSSTMITNNTTCNASGAPLPPPRRAASQQRFVQKKYKFIPGEGCLYGSSQLTQNKKKMRLRTKSIYWFHCLFQNSFLEFRHFGTMIFLYIHFRLQKIPRSDSVIEVCASS